MELALFGIFFFFIFGVFLLSTDLEKVGVCCFMLGAACFVFLITIFYIRNDCDELGKFRTNTGVYQCQLIQESVKNGN